MQFVWAQTRLKNKKFVKNRTRWPYRLSFYVKPLFKLQNSCQYRASCNLTKILFNEWFFSHWSRTKEICKPVYAAKVIIWALLWLWHLFHVIHYNRPNLKVVKVLAIDRKLTWEKNESLTVSSFCRSYGNWHYSKYKMHAKCQCALWCRADKGRVASL